MHARDLAAQDTLPDREVLLEAANLEQRPAADRALADGALLLDREPAAVEVARLLDAVREVGLVHALVERVRAARAKLAPAREVDERGWRAFDRGEALRLRPVEPRDRAE